MSNTTARFDYERLSKLDKVFKKNTLTSNWRNVVKGQLRRLEILDLHDYYDFNVNIDEKSDRIRKRVLSGRYRANKPIIYKVEKKFGIARHLMVPSPSDALVFQTLANHLARDLKNKQPSSNAYFSRDRHNLKLPHQSATDSIYLWQELWVKFQLEIYEFSKSYNFLVVTDIANFFDHIDLRQLRNLIPNYFEVDEVVLDVMFNMIEEISWTPDYLPNTLIGLPTINIEAPRILAHIMLFEVDNILMKKTNNSFVRWMDDINFGVDDYESAKKILGDINDVLKSRGLALNLSKTQIYTAKEAQSHFLFEENKEIDELLDKIEEGGYSKGELAKELEDRYKSHRKREHLKNWDKVLKRYFTVGARLKTTRLLKYSFKLFENKAGVRSNILYYLSALGFKKYTSEFIVELLDKIETHDDVTIFQIIKTVTDMNIPIDKEGRDFIDKVENVLLDKIEDKQFNFHCYIWFAAKYSHPENFYPEIMKHKRLWYNDDFLGRQVMAVIPKIYIHFPERAANLLEDQINKGASDVSSVAANIKSFMELETYPKGMNLYLFPSEKPKVYPLPKFLILLSVIQSKHFCKDEKFIQNIKRYVTDEWYLFWFKKYNYL